jgi:hypothetical protein
MHAVEHKATAQSGRYAVQEGFNTRASTMHAVEHKATAQSGIYAVQEGFKTRASTMHAVVHKATTPVFGHAATEDCVEKLIENQRCRSKEYSLLCSSRNKI